MGVIKHGMTGTPEYKAWCAIRARCNNKDDVRYHDYGGRGIVMCKRWNKSFVNFYVDMGVRPSKESSIDRINNNGPYAKWNCRWATNKEQANNKSSNHLLKFNGRVQTITQWAHEVGIRKDTLRLRVIHGWPIRKALYAPLGSRVMPYKKGRK